MQTLAEDLDHPEDVCWSPTEQVVYAGSEAGDIYRLPFDGGEADVVCRIPNGFLLGMALDAQERLYVCDPGNRTVHRVTPDASVQPYGDPIDFPNYPVFEANGVLWVSDSGEVEEATGRLVKIWPDGRTETVDTRPLMFANGLAIRDGYIYIVESSLPGVSRLPMHGGPVEPVVDLPRSTPDGLAFDRGGGLWIACFQPNCIYRLSPGGNLECVLEDWSGEFVFAPTNVAFAGPALDTLLIATIGAWWIRTIRPGVAGEPLHYPDLA